VEEKIHSAVTKHA